MTGRIFLRAVLTALVFIGLASVSAFAGEDWKPIDPAHLAMKTPVVEADADADGAADFHAGVRAVDFDKPSAKGRAAVVGALGRRLGRGRGFFRFVEAQRLGRLAP